MSTRKRHIISILLQNEVGALTRVASLFATRGYNIESLNVAPTDDPTVSRLTLVTTGTDAVIQQIVNQSLKLIDVVNVDDMTRDQHVERELLLIKLRAAATQTRRACRRACTKRAAKYCRMKRKALPSSLRTVNPRSTSSSPKRGISAKYSRSCAAVRWRCCEEQRRCAPKPRGTSRIRKPQSGY